MQASHWSSCLTETVRIEEGAEIAGGQPIRKRKICNFIKCHMKIEMARQMEIIQAQKYPLLRNIPTFLYSLFFLHPFFFATPHSFKSMNVTQQQRIQQQTHSYFSITLSFCLSLLLSYLLLNSSTTSSFQLRFQQIFFLLLRLPKNLLPLYSTPLLSNLAGLCLARGLYSIYLLKFQMLDARNSKIKQL